MVDLKEQVKTLTARLGGRKPFTTETWSGQTRPGISLNLNQTFRSLSLFCSNTLSLFTHVKPALTPGQTYHFVEFATGFDTPAPVLAGHTLFTFEFTWAISEIAEMTIYFDGQLYMGGPIETLIQSLGFSNYFLGTDLVDPTALLPHAVDVTLKNLGTENLEGYLGILAVDTVLGTKIPKTKKVKCKWCGAVKEVPNNTTINKCRVCGKETWYYPIIMGGR